MGKKSEIEVPLIQPESRGGGEGVFENALIRLNEINFQNAVDDDYVPDIVLCADCADLYA
jgi:hypothetical protein